MKIQLWTDLDQIKSKNAYNLALMKISAWHKARGDTVEWADPLFPCDILYLSKIFDDKYTQPFTSHTSARQVKFGGTGYNLSNALHSCIEHHYPDYSLYPHLRDTAVGFLTRGCPNNCHFCICTQKEGSVSRQVADLHEFRRGQKTIELLDPNILACIEREKLFFQLSASRAEIIFRQGLDARLIDIGTIPLLRSCNIKKLFLAWDLERFSEPIKRGLLLLKSALPHIGQRELTVYVLVNFNTQWEFDIERVEWLRRHGFSPYIMIFNKPQAHKKYAHLQRAVNNRFIFYKMKSLAEYAPLKPFLLTPNS